MEVAQLRDTIAAGKPFKLTLAGGKTYDVPHPDYVHIHPMQRSLWIFTDPNGARFDVVEAEDWRWGTMKRRVIGRVTSDKMNKTIRVSILRRVRDLVTGKILSRDTVCLAHDEGEQAKLWDVVELVEARPSSKRKRWSFVKVISRVSE